MSVRIGILKNNVLKSMFLYHPDDIKKLCELLKSNYNKASIVEELIKQGDIYSLKDNILESKFYQRDYGDPFESCKAFSEPCEKLEDVDTHCSPVDYYVIWTNKWNVCTAYESNWLSIAKFLNKLKKNEKV